MHNHNTAPKHKTRNYRQDRCGRWRPMPLRADRKDLTTADYALGRLHQATTRIALPRTPSHPGRKFPARALLAVLGAISVLP